MGGDFSFPRSKRREQPTVDVHECLHNHTNEFKEKEVIQVVDNVYLAIGFALANSALIVGETGCVVVDTTESKEAATEVFEAFKPYKGDKPISACIYTHNHTDHVMGTRSFMEEDGTTQVWAHELTAYYLDRVIQVTGEVTYKRAMRQFGVFVPEAQFINSGIGPFLRVGDISSLAFPTHTFTDRKKINIAGLELELIHAPGETNDQTYVYYPAKNLLCAGDNIYKAFPNIYAIRGTPSRDAMQWARSLDLIRDLKPEHLVLGHTRPISGAANISDIVTSYRDAIQFCHDQTIRLMNGGMFLDDIVESVVLPEELRTHDFLQEFYGTVEFTVRAVFNHYLGWFGGDPAQLRPLPGSVRGENLIKLAGGENRLLAEVRSSLDKSVDATGEEQREHVQWALELVTSALQANPKSKAARKLKVEALRSSASLQIAATARNYYLTQAMETEKSLKLQLDAGNRTAAVQKVGTMLEIMKLLSYRVNPEKSDKNRGAIFSFTDTKETVSLVLRRGICCVSGSKDTIESKVDLLTLGSDDDKIDVVVEVKTQVWRDVVSKKRSAALALAGGDIKVTKGNARSFAALMASFETK